MPKVVIRQAIKKLWQRYSIYLKLANVLLIPQCQLLKVKDKR
ncbi:hypothetical protein HMPREF9078_00621 [Capnocytophaga sp. oral taxon 380 str. F0488]|nr:hypothetical protein HMPREF9078_00621 [Capnocytophaga sp. oral taxon 380 str. F0488]